jgi:hypothetical protein
MAGGLFAAALHFCSIGDSRTRNSERPISLSMHSARPRDEAGNRRNPPTNTALAEVDSKESKVDCATKNNSHVCLSVLSVFSSSSW